MESIPGIEYDPIFKDVELGIGTWAWGDRMVWQYGNGYTEQDIENSFLECVENGVRFFDTAEVYGQGKSESILGSLIKKTKVPITIATKMMPFPWRLSRQSLRNALKHSLQRLGVEKVDLYQMHWPLPLISVSVWMEQMSDLLEEGLISAIGVSNYNLEQTKKTQETLKKRGHRLASNQVEYHLLNRRIETNGLMDYCRTEGIKIIAYSPLAMGILTGKYTSENPPAGTRATQYNRLYLAKIQSLIKVMRKIGIANGEKTVGQVALNWLISKHTLPIPGVKNVTQAQQNLGALGWQLGQEDIDFLDKVSDELNKG